LTLQVSSLCSTVRAEDSYYYYYCPYSDALLSGSKSELSGLATNAYPERHENGKLVPREYGPVWTWHFTDCSSSEFVCLDARNGGGVFQRRLFLPRKIEAGHQYIYGTARVVIYDAATTRDGVLQAVLWEKMPSGKESPMKLMWERQRGVIAIEGLVLSNLGQKTETCMLESKTGYFANGVAKRERRPRRIGARVE
jgi:hypothetical protein